MGIMSENGEERKKEVKRNGRRRGTHNEEEPYDRSPSNTHPVTPQDLVDTLNPYLKCTGWH